MRILVSTISLIGIINYVIVICIENVLFNIRQYFIQVLKALYTQDKIKKIFASSNSK